MGIKDQQTEKPEANIIENGRCVICGKPLEGNRLFVCEDCSKKDGNRKVNSLLKETINQRGDHGL